MSRALNKIVLEEIGFKNINFLLENSIEHQNRTPCRLYVNGSPEGPLLHRGRGVDNGNNFESGDFEL